jgi:hypothetical protein
MPCRRARQAHSSPRFARWWIWKVPIKQPGFVTDVRETRLTRLLGEATVTHDLALREHAAAERETGLSRAIPPRDNFACN